MLEGLIPLRELDEAALAALAAEAELEEYPAKTVVARRGVNDRYVRYVLSGEVLVVGNDGSRRSLIGMGNAAIAAEPLGLEDPCPFNAIACTEVKLICLSRERIEEQLNARPLFEYQVDEVAGADGTAGDHLFCQLIQDLMQDRLALPSMPEIALRVRQAINDPNAGANEVARIIQADPVVAARIIQAANSATFAGQKAAGSLNGAIVRLGLKTVREVIVAATMHGVFQTKHSLLRRRMMELWTHSTVVAAISTVLSRKLRGFNPDLALLAGLVHDIGVVPILAHAHDYDELTQDPELLESTITAYRGQIGAMILRRWNFSDELITAVLEAEDWYRTHESQADYADLIIVSQLQSYSGTEASRHYPSLDELPVYERLGLTELGISERTPILEEAHEEIAAVQRLLSG
ncbi:predicted signal transduction protein [Nitrococcus mobilis Nb-231]|uniref:Predicted signal transduction protein n=2 Tax=Nitrococcus mobilis TaxID=35797 RepID=A4BPE3_9GAMM|nr:predicted signal transduction protein [Nitrococcus mobilis Nb-231]